PPARRSRRGDPPGAGEVRGRALRQGGGVPGVARLRRGPRSIRLPRGQRLGVDRANYPRRLSGRRGTSARPGSGPPDLLRLKGSTMEQVKLYDTTLRDGMQGEGMSLSASEKARVVLALDRLGVQM